MTNPSFTPEGQALAERMAEELRDDVHDWHVRAGQACLSREKHLFIPGEGKAAKFDFYCKVYLASVPGHPAVKPGRERMGAKVAYRVEGMGGYHHVDASFVIAETEAWEVASWLFATMRTIETALNAGAAHGRAAAAV